VTAITPRDRATGFAVTYPRDASGGFRRDVQVHWAPALFDVCAACMYIYRVCCIFCAGIAVWQDVVTMVETATRENKERAEEEAANKRKQKRNEARWASGG